MQSFTGIVIEDGRVKQLLTSKDDAKPIANATVIDGGGKNVLPGLTDAHGHVLGLGEEKLQADLRGTTSIDDALGRIRKHIAANPNARWVIGRGWNQVLWKERRFPTARELDAVVADRPAVMTRVDGHATWVNSAALKVAGITAANVDPQGGQIVRDASGQPTGVLVDTAEELIEKHIPSATDAEIKSQLLAAMNEAASLGMTGVHDAGIDGHTYDLYRELGAAGRLPIRIYAMLRDSADDRRLMQSGPRMPEYDDRLQMRAVKAWADGALGSRGAALMQDYSDQPHHRGLMMYTREQMQELATLTASKGWQLNVHAIGDAGNRLVLDTLDTMLTKEQRHALRPRIEHAQVIALDDIRRFARLEVIASIQPTHATSDMNMAEDRARTAARPGRLRMAQARQCGRAPRGRQRLPGRASESVLRPVRSRHAPGSRRPPARRLVSAGEADARGSAAAVHDRCRVRRAHGARDRLAGAGQVGRLHHRRPGLLQDPRKRDRRHQGARDVRGGEEGGCQAEA